MHGGACYELIWRLVYEAYSKGSNPVTLVRKKAIQMERWMHL